jgi:hypothetical protein
MLFGNLYSELFQIWKILNFLEENLELFLKKGQKISKSVWVQARELKN